MPYLFDDADRRRDTEAGMKFIKKWPGGLSAMGIEGGGGDADFDAGAVYTRGGWGIMCLAGG
jgi:hypothetical protein